MDELLAHLFGDYVVQSDWMAVEKTEHHVPALAHAVTYAACFIPLTRSPARLAVIAGTHFAIDRWRLARRLVWAKNQAAPQRWRHPYDEHMNQTGYHRFDPEDWNVADCDRQAKPPWLAFWLMIAADNAVHMLINRLALFRRA